MLKLCPLISASVLGLALLTSNPAHADTISTFSFTGTFTSAIYNGPYKGSATGTVTIDTTTGQAISEDLTYQYLDTVHFTNTVYKFTTISDQGFSAAWNETTIYPSSVLPEFYLAIPGSLIDYAGGNICSLNSECFGTGSGGLISDIQLSYVAGPNMSLYSQSGGLSFESSITTRPTDPTSPTPEPNTLALLGTGILGAAGVLRRRLLA